MRTVIRDETLGKTRRKKANFFFEAFFTWKERENRSFSRKITYKLTFFITNFWKRAIFSQFFAKNAFFLAVIFRQHYKKTKIDIIFTNNIKILREIF